MPNRTLCEVLEEMRTCYKTRNFSYLEGLIEECQTLANRMEAALWDQKDVKRLRNDIKSLKDKKSDLENLIDNLKTKAREAGVSKPEDL